MLALWASRNIEGVSTRFTVNNTADVVDSDVATVSSELPELSSLTVAAPSRADDDLINTRTSKDLPALTLPKRSLNIVSAAESDAQLHYLQQGLSQHQSYRKQQRKKVNPQR